MKKTSKMAKTNKGLNKAYDSTEKGVLAKGCDADKAMAKRKTRVNKGMTGRGSIKMK